MKYYNFKYMKNSRDIKEVISEARASFSKQS